MFHDTTAESHMNDDIPKPVPPLTAKTADGKPYTRFADVEAEIRKVQDCVMSGRQNCAPIETPSALRH